jgi:hypothetical protein
LQFVATPTRKKEEKLVHKHSLQQWYKNSILSAALQVQIYKRSPPSQDIHSTLKLTWLMWPKKFNSKRSPSSQEIHSTEKLTWLLTKNLILSAAPQVKKYTAMRSWLDLKNSILSAALQVKIDTALRSWLDLWLETIAAQSSTHKVKALVANTTWTLLDLWQT